MNIKQIKNVCACALMFSALSSCLVKDFEQEALKLGFTNDESPFTPADPALAPPEQVPGVEKIASGTAPVKVSSGVTPVKVSSGVAPVKVSSGVAPVVAVPRAKERVPSGRQVVQSGTAPVQMKK